MVCPPTLAPCTAAARRTVTFGKGKGVTEARRTAFNLFAARYLTVTGVKTHKVFGPDLCMTWWSGITASRHYGCVGSVLVGLVRSRVANNIKYNTISNLDWLATQAANDGWMNAPNHLPALTPGTLYCHLTAGDLQPGEICHRHRLLPRRGALWGAA